MRCAYWRKILSMKKCDRKFWWISRVLFLSFVWVKQIHQRSQKLKYVRASSTLYNTSLNHVLFWRRQRQTRPVVIVRNSPTLDHCPKHLSLLPFHWFFFSVLPFSVGSAYLWLTALQNSVHPRMKDENFWRFIILVNMLIFICMWMHWNYVQNTQVKPPGNKLGPWQWILLELLSCLVLPTWWHCVGIWDEMVAISCMAFPHYGELLEFYKKKIYSKPSFLYQMPFLGLQKSLGLQPSSTFQYRYNQSGRHHQRWVILKHHYKTSFQYECKINSSK